VILRVGDLAAGRHIGPNGPERVAEGVQQGSISLENRLVAGPQQPDEHPAHTSKGLMAWIKRGKRGCEPAGCGRQAFQKARVEHSSQARSSGCQTMDCVDNL
jgi:hypothetical protein